MRRLVFACLAQFLNLQGKHMTQHVAPRMPKLSAQYAWGVLVASGFYLQYRRLYADPAEQKRVLRDVAHLDIPPAIAEMLAKSRLGLEHNDIVEAAVFAARAAELALGAHSGEEILAIIGEQSCAMFQHTPELLLFGIESWPRAAIANVHRSLLAMIVAQNESATNPSLVWLAGAAHSAGATKNAFMHKLFTDAMDANWDNKMARSLNIIVKLNDQQLRPLQFQVLILRRCVLATLSAQGAAGDSEIQTHLATCCLDLQRRIIRDIGDPRKIAPQAVVTMIWLEKMVLRLLPSEEAACSTPALSDARVAFGRLYTHRAVLSSLSPGPRALQCAEAALTWFGPSDSRYADVQRMRDTLRLKVIQEYREKHGKEIVA